MREAKGNKTPVVGKNGIIKYKARAYGQYLGLFPSEEEADIAIAEALAVRDPGDAKTCRQYAPAWFKAREESGIVRNVSFDRSTWRACVEQSPLKRTWLDMEPNRVRTHHVQEWLDALAQRSGRKVLRRKTNGVWTYDTQETGRRLTTDVLRKAASRAKLFFRWLKATGKLKGENPAANLIMPVGRRKVRKGRQRIIHLTAQEIEALFAQPLPPRQRSAFTVAVYAGLRPGELWGLRWEDVDFEARKFYVRSSRTGDVKTATAIRDVPMLPAAHKALLDYRASLPARPMRGLVWPAPHGGCVDQCYTGNWSDRQFRRWSGPHKGERAMTPGWRTRAGIRPEVTFACLRHTNACHLLQGTLLGNAAPTSLEDVSAWLGHSDISVTQRHYAEFSLDNIHTRALGPQSGNQSGNAPETPRKIRGKNR